CNTMNGMWGYKLVDRNYKDVATLVRYLVRTASLGANLLLNVGPQPNGEFPAAAVERLRGMGQWLQRYGETIYGTEGGGFKPLDWGGATRKGSRMFVHVTDNKAGKVTVPLDLEVASAAEYGSSAGIRFEKTGDGIMLHLPPRPEETIDYIVELNLKD
ncbi:MAG: alpha-L-fucosidase, partial [Muribaculaceae bacterium]|nr:alpha-L-fucosidase [Muribaculaceae bacterium]